MCMHFQGFPSDESDDEWDSHILQTHGLLGATQERGERPNGGDADDDSFDLTFCLSSAFNTYDNLCGEQFPGEAEEQRQEPIPTSTGVNGPHEVRDNIGDTSGDRLSDDDAGDRQHMDVECNNNASGAGQEEPPAEPSGSESPLHDDGATDDAGVERNTAEDMEIDSDDDDIPQRTNAPENPISTEEAYLRDAARTPLFPDSTISMLSAVILILNCMRMHGASSVLIDEVLTLLSKVLLPRVNSLPTTEYEASKLLKKLGLNYQTIDVCPNHCLLFRGPVYGDMDRCPKCGADRRRRCGKSMVARRVLRYFPLIPRLVRLFRNPILAAAMTYAALHKSLDNKMRSVADSEIWKFIDSMYPSFASDPRNVRLALATDGVNPFGEKRNTYSIWPVMLLNYNVAPWLTLKKFYVMLSYIIPGRKSVTGEQWDMYMEPLLEELRHLWSVGTPIRDASKPLNESFHQLRAVLMFTINDYPAYGIVSGLVTKGYKGCVCCGPNTICRRSKFLGKNVWDHQHRMYLPAHHYLRENERQFRGEAEHRFAPPRMTGAETKRCGMEREEWLRNGGTKGSVDDPVRRHGVKRVSALFTLPYWEVTYNTLPWAYLCSFIDKKKRNTVGKYVYCMPLTSLSLLMYCDSYDAVALFFY